jgi:hypothetical protein
LLAGLIGYLFKAWLDKREYERRQSAEEAKKRVEEKIVRGATIEEVYAIEKLSSVKNRV